MINTFLKTLNKKKQPSRSDLIDLLRNHFNLRIQFKLGQLKQLHYLRKTRRNIASLKFFLDKKNGLNKNHFK